MKIFKTISRMMQLVFFGMIALALLGWFALMIDLEKQPANAVSEFTAEIYQPLPTPGGSLRAMEGNAEIKIPPSAREIHARTSGFRELDTWVRLDLPAQDLGAFMLNTRCTTSLVAVEPKPSTTPHANGIDPEWWTPYKGARLMVCSGLHNYISQRILVDYTRSDMLRIYVFSATDDYTAYTTQTP